MKLNLEYKQYLESLHSELWSGIFSLILLILFVYELAYFKTYDSCFVDIYNKGLVVWWEYLSLDSTQIINKIDNLNIPDMRDKIFW